MADASLDELAAASARLGEAIIDPAAWPGAMEGICRALGTTGAIMLQSDVRTPDVPHTASLGELTDIYFRQGWHLDDIRGRRSVPRFFMGERVLVDQDLFTRDELRREPYYHEFMIPNGFRWFAAIAFRAETALWALALQRTPREGPFEADTKRLLAQLSQRLSEAATLSKAISRTILAGTANALDLVKQPAMAVDRSGLVLASNEAADMLLGKELRVRNRRLYVADAQARAELERLADRIRVAGDTDPLPAAPIVVRRQGRASIVIRILPIEPAARSPFLGARALLTLLDLDEKRIAEPSLLMQTFGLTKAEARLAARVGAGESVELAAEKLTISPLTARTQLKAVFAKTDMHRQGELVALVSRLRSLST